MKLIEKKCPNCGASLEFSETDKSCKCQYCHRAFEIERDNDTNVKDLAQQFNLSELEKPAKIVGGVAIAMYSIFAILFIAVVIFIGTSIYDFNKNGDSFFDEGKNENKVVSDINDFSNHSLTLLSNDSVGALDVKGESSTKYSYEDKDHEVYKYILAYKDGKNYVYIVQKALYINFFNADDKKTVFIPVKYENVFNNLSLVDDDSEEVFDSMTIDAPEFYLNDEKSSYIRGGYSDYNQFIEEKINPLKNQGYKITEK